MHRVVVSNVLQEARGKEKGPRTKGAGEQAMQRVRCGEQQARAREGAKGLSNVRCAVLRVRVETHASDRLERKFLKPVALRRDRGSGGQGTVRALVVPRQGCSLRFTQVAGACWRRRRRRRRRCPRSPRGQGPGCREALGCTRTWRRHGSSMQVSSGRQRANKPSNGTGTNRKCALSEAREVVTAAPHTTHTHIFSAIS
jgi:hypothetical protein